MNRTIAWICLFLISLWPLTSYAQSVQSISIDWRIDGRFRLLTDPVVGDALGEVALMADKIRGGLKRNDPDDNTIVQFYETLDNSTIFIKNGGHLGFRSMPGTYYNEATATYAPGYANPKSWRIVLNAKGASNTDSCSWFKDGLPLKGKGINNDCTEFAASVDFGPDEAIVELRVNDDSHRYQEKIKPHDMLVIGLGDSYASGEGNPDVKKHWFSDSTKWLDKKCHRSLFSWQSLVAARLAIEDPHRSVTFVGYACSGAETRHLFRNKYQGAIPKIEVQGRGNMLEPQLTSVKRTLCSGNWDEKKMLCDGSLRQPDFILLSTGGNDVGFGPLIAASIMKDVTHDTSGEGIDLDFRYKDRIDRDLGLISADLKQFAVELDNAFGDESKRPKTRVIHALYPNPLMRDGKNGSFCGRGKDYQGSPVLRLAGRTVFIEWLMRFFGAVETPSELKSIHESFIIPLTGTVSEDPYGDMYERRGLRQLCIGLQCIDDNLRNVRLVSSELSKAAQFDCCRKYWEDGSGFLSSPQGKRWSMVMLRNEECKQEGDDRNCAYQKDGFVTNGYCLPQEAVDGRWFNILYDSVRFQGTQHGVFHPNFYGHLYYVKRVYPEVEEALKTAE